MDDNEVTNISNSLKQLQPGILPYDIFIQVARLTVLSIIEVVPIKMVDNEPNILLLARQADDEFWPGMLHIPGVVLLPTDDNLTYNPIDRIIKNELNGLRLSKLTYVTNKLRQTERGKEYVHLYLAEIDDDPTTGELYKLSDLPPNLIKYHEELIKKATEKYLVLS